MSLRSASVVADDILQQRLFSTRLTDLFGVRHPIILGGMQWLSRAPIVAAAARSGIMSFMTPRSYETADAFREGLAECVDLADGAPFGVNFSISRFRGRNEMNAEFLEIAQKAGIRCFETAGSHPGDLIDAIHDGGGVLIHKSTQVRHALKAQASGVDAVTIVGMEAGGHPGVNPHPSHVLLSEALKELEIPAALGGAIGTGRQLLGALAQGADAAIIVTRFLASQESWAHQGYKDKLVASRADDSVAALQTIKDTWRVLDNATVRKVMEIEKQEGVTHADFGELVRGQYTRDNAYTRGDTEKGMISCSAAVGHIDAVRPISETVAQLLLEAKDASDRLRKITV